MSFPQTLDNLATDKGDNTPSFNDHPNHHNALATALNAVEAFLLLGAVQPESHGAVGDGVADDTQALKDAIGTDRHVALVYGKTYLISADLTLHPGRHFYGNGATLKRANQVATTTTSAIVSGTTTQIVVASTSGLAVNKRIVLEKAGTFDTQSRRISDITGTTVTVSQAFGISSASGTVNVYTTHHGIYGDDDCHVYDVVIDGNSANNAFARWQTTTEIEMAGDRSLVSGCRIHDAPGEAIVLFGDFSNAVGCVMEDIGGNGIHFGNSEHIVVDRCRVRNANLDASVGHSDGGIIWSNTIQDCTVSKCYVENAKCGIGSVDYFSNSDVTVTGNTIRDCDVAFEGTFPLDQYANNVVFTGNRIYDSGTVQINQVDGASTAFPERFIVANNVLVNTLLLLVRANDVIVEGNIVHMVSDTTSTVIQVSACKRVKVRGNIVTGGSIGINVGGGQYVSVVDNTCRNQNLVGVNNSSAGTDILVADNQVTNDSTASASYDGIKAFAGAVVRGNTLTLNKGHAGIYPQNGAIIKDNTVHHGTATYTIRADGGSTGIIIKDNEVAAAISDAGTNTVSGQIVIP